MKTKLFFAVSLLFLTSIIFNSCTIVRVVKYVKNVSKSKPAKKHYYEKMSFNFQNRHIVLPAKINGNSEEELFILDTGAPTLVSSELYEKYQFPAVFKAGDSADAAAYDNRKGNLTRSVSPTIKSLQLGNTTFNEVGSIAFHLKKMGHFSCYAPAGIIGVNVMNDGIWQINYDTETLIFTNDFSKLESIEGAYEIPFETTSFMKNPIIKISLGDSIYRVIFDLGSANSLQLDSIAGSAIKGSLSENRKRELLLSNFSSAYGEEFTNQKYNLLHTLLPELKIGDFSFTDIKASFVSIPTAGKSRLMKNDYQGTLGNDFLKDYIVTISWKNKLIYLKPNKKEKQVNNSFYGITYGFDQDNKLIIEGVVLNTEASNAGIFPKEQILQINNINTETFTEDQVCEIHTGIKRIVLETDEKIKLTILHHDGRTGTYTFNKVPLFPNLEFSGNSAKSE